MVNDKSHGYSGFSPKTLIGCVRHALTSRYTMAAKFYEYCAYLTSGLWELSCDAFQMPGGIGHLLLYPLDANGPNRTDLSPGFISAYFYRHPKWCYEL